MHDAAGAINYPHRSTASISNWHSVFNIKSSIATNMSHYDLYHHWRWSAGLTAGLYASRARLATLLLEKRPWAGRLSRAIRLRITPAVRERLPDLNSC